MRSGFTVLLFILASITAIANPCVQTMSDSWGAPDNGLPFGFRWLVQGQAGSLQYDWYDGGIRCCYRSSVYGGDLVYYFLFVSNLEAGDFIRVEYDMNGYNGRPYGIGYWGNSGMAYDDYTDTAYSISFSGTPCENSSQIWVPQDHDSLLIGFRVEHTSQSMSCGILRGIHLILPDAAIVLSTDGTVGSDSTTDMGSIKSLYR